MTRDFIAGRGFGVKYLYDELAPHIDRLIGQCRIVFDIPLIVGRVGSDERVMCEHLRLLFGAHKQQELVHGALADRVGHRVLDAALLNAGVDDAGHVVRQGEIGHGLHEQQDHGGQYEENERFEIFG